MTSIAVVRKGRTAAIAADTLTKQGSCRVPSAHKASPSKFLTIGDAVVAVPGSIAKLRMMQSLARHHPDRFHLNSIDEIFETFRDLHETLVDEYHVMTSEDEGGQPFESSQLNLLIASPGGIFEVQSYREVQEYTRFWATGSGYEMVLGALGATYDPGDDTSAVDLARRAVEVACEFDDSSDGPVLTAEVDLSV